FAKLVATGRVEKTPMLEVIKRHPREILLSAFARMGEQAPFYIFTAFVFSYGTGTLKVSRDFLLTAVLAASILSFVSIPFFGHLARLSARVNHRGRSGAADRRVAVWPVPHALRHRVVHRGMRDHQPRRGRADDRLHRQGDRRRAERHRPSGSAIARRGVLVA